MKAAIHTLPAIEPGTLDAVVLAGGLNTRELYPGYQPGYKALVDLDGKPLIRYVLDALGGSPAIRRIGVVGSEPDLRPVIGPDIPMGPAGDSLLGSVMSALSLFPDSERVLLATADLAMLLPEMVDSFLGLCAAHNLRFENQVFIAVVPRERFTGPFAPCGKNYNHFGDVEICHGNLLLASTGLLRSETAKRRLDAMYAGRKNPITSAMAFGLSVGLTYVVGVHLLHRVTLPRMAEVASRRFGFDIVPVLCPYPQVGIDIDEAGDFRIAREVLAARVG